MLFYKLFAPLSFICALSLCLAIPAFGKEGAQASQGLRAQPWAFGQSMDRDAKIWHKGVSASSINKKAKKGSRARELEDRVEASMQKNDKAKGKLGLSFADEQGQWKVAPEQKRLRPDEEHVRDRRHVLRAYAGMEAGEDFNISVGPELILKDDQHGDEAAKADQPDSALGLGMRFQYDF